MRPRSTLHDRLSEVTYSRCSFSILSIRANRFVLCFQLIFPNHFKHCLIIYFQQKISLLLKPIRFCVLRLFCFDNQCYKIFRYISRFSGFLASATPKNMPNPQPPTTTQRKRYNFFTFVISEFHFPEITRLSDSFTLKSPPTHSSHPSHTTNYTMQSTICLIHHVNQVAKKATDLRQLYADSLAFRSSSISANLSATGNSAPYIYYVPHNPYCQIP